LILNNNKIITKLLKEAKTNWNIDKNLAPIEYIKKFFLILSNSNNNIDKYIQLYLYEFFTHESVRDRKVTSREFEDFLSLLLDAKVTDELKRKNNNIDNDLKNKISELYPSLIQKELQEIIFDLSTNKREKADLILKDGTNISIKTLKGFSLCDIYIKNLPNISKEKEEFIKEYCKEFPSISLETIEKIKNYLYMPNCNELKKIYLNKTNKKCNELKNLYLEKIKQECPEYENLKKLYQELKDKLKPNTELNIGALSHRGLFKNIVDEKLSDRKDGLGSRQQIIELLNKIENNGKLDKFKERLKFFLDYVYGNEIYFIAYKSGIKMQIFIFQGKELNNILVNLLDQCIPCFAAIFHRWENNNLRLNIEHLINKKLWIIDKSEEYIDKKNFSFNIKGKKFECKIDNNPFRKENLIVIDFRKALDDQNFIEKIKTSQKEYIDNLLKNIKN